MPMYEFFCRECDLFRKSFQAGAQRVELCDNLAVGGHDTFLWCYKGGC